MSAERNQRSAGRRADAGSVWSHLGDGVALVLARPRVLLFLLLFAWLLPLAVALPLHHSAQQHLAHAVPAPGDPVADFAESAPAWMFRAWQRESAGAPAVAAQALVPLMLFASLFQLVVAGGWMSVAVRGRRQHGLRAFLRGGGRWFWPFLRTWLLGLPLLWLVTWIFWSTPAEWVFGLAMPEGDPELASSERTVRWLEGARQILYLLALLEIEIVLDLARASLVVGERRSATLGVLRGMGFLMRRPLPVFGIVLLGFAIELLWITGCKAAVAAVPLPLWTLVAVLPLGRIVMRGARWSALASLYGAAAGPPARERARDDDLAIREGTVWPG